MKKKQQKGGKRKKILKSCSFIEKKPVKIFEKKKNYKGAWGAADG